MEGGVEWKVVRKVSGRWCGVEGDVEGSGRWCGVEGDGEGKWKVVWSGRWCGR